MKQHRFFIGKDGIEKEGTRTDASLAHQLKKVLRMRSGDTVVFFDASGNEYTVIIKGVDGPDIAYEIVGRKKNTEEGIKAHLFASIIKRENFEWIVQKATECGVASITPIRTERTIKMDLKMERLEKIIKEAAEQSGRGYIPKLFPIKEFGEILSEPEKNTVSVLFDAAGEDADVFFEKNRKDARLFVGPEGGWTEQELVSAKEHGIFTANLGTFTLRAETAAVIATYISVNGNKKERTTG